jgi:glutaminase
LDRRAKARPARPTTAYDVALSAKGNSIRGTMAYKELASQLGLHTFEFTNVGSTFMQSIL